MTNDPNPVRAASDSPPAVIAGAWRTGVLGMRSLRRRGVEVCAVDCNYGAFTSAYGRALACPNPDTDAAGWVAFMLDLARTMKRKPVLIASSDQFVSAIAAHADTLANHFVFSPGVRLQGMLATKEAQYRLAAEHGMPMPNSKQVSTLAEVEAFAAGAQFPCLLKPLHFREWQAFPAGHTLSHAKVAIADTPAQLVAHWRLASAVNPNTILQEIIEGPDTAKRVYVSCYDAESRRIGCAIFRELRCDPLGFGPATVTEPVVDSETDKVCDRFLRAIGYSGVCEIEMKRDSRDGRVKLIEANPRLTGGGDAAPHAGVDVCWLHYLDLTGQRVTPVKPHGKDFRHIVLRSDVIAMVNYKRAGLISWKDIRHSYRPPLAFFDLDGRDWRYSAETLYRVARTAVGMFVKPLLRRTGRS